MRAFSSSGLLIVVASLVKQRLQGVQASVTAACRLSTCGTQAWLLRGLWDLPGPEIKLESPELASRFLSAGKSKVVNYFLKRFKE